MLKKKRFKKGIMNRKYNRKNKIKNKNLYSTTLSYDQNNYIKIKVNAINNPNKFEAIIVEDGLKEV